MVADYARELYTPAAESSRAMAADSFAGARDLAGWRARVSKVWPGVRVEHVESAGVDDVPQLDQTLVLRALVQLGDLSPSDVEVQAAYGHVDENDEITEPVIVPMQLVDGNEGGLHRYETQLPLRQTGAYGYSVRVFPAHPLLASHAELGLIATP
jgi:starch phosphorylase